MESKYLEYVFSSSLTRLKDLVGGQFSYEERSSIPPRAALTYANGFYVKGTAIFVDLRDSTELSKNLKRPTLARAYRAFISELVAVFQGCVHTREVYVEGDCVWGMMDTPNKLAINQAFAVACQCNSLVKTLRYLMEEMGLPPLHAGIGLAYGRALMIKAGHNGSGTNEIVWLGSVVSRAAELCGLGDREDWFWGRSDPIFLDSSIFINLNEHNQSLCEEDSEDSQYKSSAVNVEMSDWLTSQDMS